LRKAYRETDRQTYGGRDREVDTNSDNNLVTRIVDFQFIYPFMVYTAICQQHWTGHVAHQAFGIMHTQPLYWG